MKTFGHPLSCFHIANRLTTFCVAFTRLVCPSCQKISRIVLFGFCSSSSWGTPPILATQPPVPCTIDPPDAAHILSIFFQSIKRVSVLFKLFFNRLFLYCASNRVNCSLRVSMPVHCSPILCNPLHSYKNGDQLDGDMRPHLEPIFNGFLSGCQ